MNRFRILSGTLDTLPPPALPEIGTKADLLGMPSVGLSFEIARFVPAGVPIEAVVGEIGSGIRLFAVRREGDVRWVVDEKAFRSDVNAVLGMETLAAFGAALPLSAGALLAGLAFGLPLEPSLAIAAPLLVAGCLWAWRRGRKVAEEIGKDFGRTLCGG